MNVNQAIIMLFIVLQVSVTFDPFMSLSVPIPRNLRLLPVMFVPCDPNTTPIKVSELVQRVHSCVGAWVPSYKWVLGY